MHIVYLKILQMSLVNRPNRKTRNHVNDRLWRVQSRVTQCSCSAMLWCALMVHFWPLLHRNTAGWSLHVLSSSEWSFNMFLLRLFSNVSKRFLGYSCGSIASYELSIEAARLPSCTCEEWNVSVSIATHKLKKWQRLCRKVTYNETDRTSVKQQREATFLFNEKLIGD